MAPDLNSLPPSRSSTTSPSMSRSTPIPTEHPAHTNIRGQSPSPSPRSASTSLQAAAAVNAGLQQEENTRRSSTSRQRQASTASHSGRRRSTVLMNLQMNDPTLPPQGEIVSESQNRTASPMSFTGSPINASGDPHHFRAPSLGEIHQELEQEQEAQVNRLLHMIRTQQQQLQQLQAASGQAQGSAPAIDESTPTSERSLSFSTQNIPPNVTSAMSVPRSPITAMHSRTSFDVARENLHRRSRTPSRTASPRLRSSSISNEGGESWNLGGRDESAYYQAETQTMIRENQMLRQRIRELERQVSELHANSSITHEPATASHLVSSTSVSEETAPIAAPADEPKQD
ncbi:hypothetical protein sscle_01g002950 [Sclerotinia sclerotiorum 1980 UF-70]|uniref:Uncharacterized protein n=1 Tax=Sclerotinia sclerotiorum (strain ATCC 18683 / 1980 / Ss-1) TaxID=665079 RepID=A0A1D9PS18_SCLS1|nr:hypothetical protein sscle_01g002950 [Sclerotinia sclerotiorum 1980 UF-70]